MSKNRLSNVCEIISGGTPQTKNAKYWDGGIGWLSVVDFNNDERFVYSTKKTITEFGVENSSTRYLEIGDIIISARGTVGALAQIGKRMCFNQSCFGLRGKKDILDNSYLYYWLKTYVAGLRQKSQGSVFETINLKTFDDIYIELSGIENQQKIASALSVLDQKIELNNKINSELEVTAQALYDYWFVQFDFPDESGRPYKTNGGAMVWNDLLKREIPANWGVRKFTEIAKIISGFPFKSSEYAKDGKYKIVTIKNVLDGEIDSSAAKTIDRLPDKLSNVCQLKIGDVLISLTGNVGRMGVVFESNLLLNQRVGKLVVVDKNYSLFSYYLLTSDEQRARLEHFSNGSSQANLSPIQAVDFQTFIPNDDVLQKFNAFITPTILQFMANKQESTQLIQLRDRLLPMLMNGQIKVV